MTERSYPISKGWEADHLVEHLASAMAHARHPSAREDARICIAEMFRRGFQVVPIKPTKEMVEAGDAKVWADMLAAAPSLTRGRVERGT